MAESRTRAEEYLDAAQELSLLRHSLADELSHLANQLESSVGGTERKPTLLEDIESLHRSLKELESVKGYVMVIEHALQARYVHRFESLSLLTYHGSERAVSQVDSATTLSSVSEYETLARFVESVRKSCSVVNQVAGQQQLHILSFLESLQHKSWLNMKRALSRSIAYAYGGSSLTRLQITSICCR